MPVSRSPNPPATPPDAAFDVGAIRETIESFVFMFILVFVFRAYVVEAFVIPSGSMAPTLLGEHIDMVCPQCGYHYTLEPPITRDHAPAVCPMCHFPVGVTPATHVSGGDHIFVDKFIYSVTPPKRWDVVVFKDPQDPHTNFIKRLVGLPGESLLIVDGNVYVKGDAPTDSWRIARKTDRPDVQRGVWQPVYHSDYIPLDRGHSAARPAEFPWSVPWVAEHPDIWMVGNRRDYRHPSSESAALHFDFERAADGGAGWYTYDEFTGSSRLHEPIEDVRIAATFIADAPGLSASLSTTTRLDDPDIHARVQTLTAGIDAQGRAYITATPAPGSMPAPGNTPGTLSSQSAVGNRQSAILSPPRTLAQRDLTPFLPGIARRMELWYVDQEASLWVDGVCVCRYDFELPIRTLVNRPPPLLYPQVTLRVSGAAVTLRQVDLDRDLFYSSQQPGGVTAEGGLAKISIYRRGNPVHMENDEFYCLGDNSPRSEDSRYWYSGGPNVFPVNPWVEARLRLAGHVQVTGVVPRQLLMGRAFFVYFPAPYAWNQIGIAIVPDFGAMRFIH